MSPRRLLSWKTLFYDVLQPVLRRLGPARGDAVLAGLGHVAGSWPSRRGTMTRSLDRARTAIGADWDVASARRELAANLARFLARDYPLDGATDAELHGRFDVRGAEHLHAALSGGRGAVLVGCHLGGYLAALHWLLHHEPRTRFLVQRPRHVSRTLQRGFDRLDGPHPQSAFFLRRHLPPAEAVPRLLRARAALREGMAVYLSGDIPWSSPNARPGRFLGQERPFLALWAELAILARAPVVPLFCIHQPHGRFLLTFDAPWHLAPGQEASAVTRYLERLEREIATHPAAAVAHLTWPCYTASTELAPMTRKSTPSPAGRGLG